MVYSFPSVFLPGGAACKRSTRRPGGRGRRYQAACSRMWSITAGRSFGSIVQRSSRSYRPARRSGRAGRTPIALSTASGNFAGVGGGEGDHRDPPRPPQPPRDRHADRGMRVDDHAGVAMDRGDRLQRLRFAAPAGVEQRPDGGRGIVPDPERAMLGELAHQSGGVLRVPVVHLEQQPLEVAGDLDVHRRRQRRRHLGEPVVSGGQRSGEDVVLVARHHQPLDRQPHPLRHEAGEHVAEVSRRHRERDGNVGGRPGAAAAVT